MSTYVRIASVETPDSAASVILCTRHQRFIFNMGEGMQRICMEHGLRFTKTEHAFVTHLASETLGGLPGFVLTLKDIKNAAALNAKVKGKRGGSDSHGGSLTLHGPPGLSEFHKATKHFMRDEGLRITTDIVEADTTATHDEMTITQLPIGFPASNKAEKGLGPSEGTAPDTPPSKRARIGDGGREIGCVCYACEATDLPGKFDSKKADELGIPKGPARSELQKGEDVTLEDGTVIESSKVVGEARPGAPVLIVACPSLELVPSLVAHGGWDRFYPKDSADRGDDAATAPCLLHTAPAEVLRSPEYAAWARRFGGGAHHIVMSQPFCSPHSVYQSVHDQTAKFNLVCSEAFPVPQQFTEDMDACSGDDKDAKILKGSPDLREIGPEELDFGGRQVVAGVPLLRFEMLSPSKMPHVDPSEAFTWYRSHTIRTSKLARFRGRQDKACASPPSPRDRVNASGSLGQRGSNAAAHGGVGGGRHRDDNNYGFTTPAGASASEVAFLGTGSAIPSKFRNVSGILARLSPTPLSNAPASEAVPSPVGSQRLEEQAASAGATAAGGGPLGGSIILDAGEGTLGHIWRMYGDRPGGSRSSTASPSAGAGVVPAGEIIGGEGGDGRTDGSGNGGVNAHRGVEQALRDLSAVWISHPHADHHLGLVRILSERNKLLMGGVRGGAGFVGKGTRGGAGGLPKLLLMGPAPVAAWLKDYGRIDPTVRGGYDFLDASLMQAGDNAPRPPPHIAAAATRALARAGILRATSVRVRHCSHAYAIVLTVAASAAKAAAAMANAAAGVSTGDSESARVGVGSGGATSADTVGKGGDWKLVYSGDCRPSDELVKEGKGAAVLIHEATFDESMRQEAINKGHSTTSEALGVGQRMGAERVILTHFSQRYTQIPSTMAGGLGTKACLAFDFMRVRLADLGWLPRSYNALAAAVAGVDVEQPQHPSSPRQRSPSHRGKGRKQGSMSSSPPRSSSAGATSADDRGRHPLPYQQSPRESFVGRRLVAGRGRGGRGGDGGEGWGAGGK